MSPLRSSGVRNADEVFRTVTTCRPRATATGSDEASRADARPAARPGAPLRVALLGCGTVGSEVARLIIGQAEDLRARIGRPLELVGIAVRRAGRERPGIDPTLFTTDAAGLVAREDVDLVIEVIGGIEPARSLILSALRHGASVVTANKALLAEDGASLFTAAEESSSDLYFEAAVAGAIPIIRPLRESLVGDEITAVIGIVNGTTNFILDKMDVAGAGFAETFAEAQELGYAEADPTADVEGFDAAAKAAILASLAFHTGSPAPTCTARASPRSPPPTSPRPPRSAAWSSCWPSASCYPPATTAPSARSRCGCTRR